MPRKPLLFEEKSISSFRIAFVAPSAHKESEKQARLHHHGFSVVQAGRERRRAVGAVQGRERLENEDVVLSIAGGVYPIATSVHDRRWRATTKVGRRAEGGNSELAWVEQEHANCAHERVTEEQIRAKVSGTVGRRFCLRRVL